MVDRRKVNQRQASPDARRPSGGGSSQSLFYMMLAFVGVVVIGGLIYGLTAGKDDAAGGNQANAGPAEPNYISVPRKKDFKPVEPWSGTVSGKQVSIRQGMTERELFDQLGVNDQHDLTYKEFAGIRTLEVPEEPGEGGVFRTRGGVKLLVKVDIDSGKVVWFMPPKRYEPPADNGGG